MKIGVIDVKNHKNELENFNGYLPQPLLSYIDKNKYYKNISKLESKDEIYKQLRNAQHFNFEEHIKDFNKWLKANPEFKDIIKRGRDDV